MYQSDFTLQIPSFSKVYETTVDLVEHEVYQSDFTLEIPKFSKVYECTVDIVPEEVKKTTEFTK